MWLLFQCLLAHLPAPVLGIDWMCVAKGMRESGENKVWSCVCNMVYSFSTCLMLQFLWNKQYMHTRWLSFHFSSVRYCHTYWQDCFSTLILQVSDTLLEAGTNFFHFLVFLWQSWNAPILLFNISLIGTCSIGFNIWESTEILYYFAKTFPLTIRLKLYLQLTPCIAGQQIPTLYM